MKDWLRKLYESLNFTPTERAVALTLVGALLLGLGIRLFRDGGGGAGRFDYSAVDAEFSAKSAAAPGGVRAADSTLATPGGEAGTPPSNRTPTGGAIGKGGTGTTAGRTAVAPKKVDLNRATKRDLMALPGVGEVIAERILVYREEHGAFAGVNDLLKVKGIGKKKLERIAPYCFVEN